MQGTTQRRIVTLHRHFDVSQSQTLLRGGSSSFDVEALQHLLEHDNHETRYCKCLAGKQRCDCRPRLPRTWLSSYQVLSRLVKDLWRLQAPDEGADAIRPLRPVEHVLPACSIPNSCAAVRQCHPPHAVLMLRVAPWVLQEV